MGWAVLALILVAMVASVRAADVSSWHHHGYNLHGMVQSQDGQFLYALDDTTVHQLRVSDLTEVSNYTTTDGFITTVFNTDQNTIAVCSNGTEVCTKHKADQIARTTGRPLRYAIRTTKAQSLEVNGAHFLGCPHGTSSDSENEPCSNPGIVWTTGTRFDLGPRSSIRFQKEDSPVVTEEFFAAFGYKTYRWFFSTQRRGGTQSTRIAQLCDGGYMQYTYVDMEVKCGENADLIMSDVVSFTANGTDHLVAVFTSRQADEAETAICVYRSRDILDRFAKNFEVCYNGSRVPTAENYIPAADSTAVCATPMSQPFLTDGGLCDGLNTYHSVVGNYSLSSQPVLNYTEAIQAVAVVWKRGEVIAYLGTANDGHIRKAVVYPVAQSRNLPMNISLGGGATLNRDMFISKNRTHVLAMTSTAVFSVPVEDCSAASDCDACLGGRDPYCGWRILENRCSIQTDNEENWISASRKDSSCPAVVSINRPYLSVKETVLLDLTLNHLPAGYLLTCTFHHGELFNQTVTARANKTDKRMIECQTPDLTSMAHLVNGSFVMGLSISTNVSSQPIIESNITYYNCDTFTSCGSCTLKEWNCAWCIYLEKCEANATTNATTNCDGTKAVGAGSETCPMVSHVQVSAAPNDSSGLYYLSNDSNYTVSFTGRHLPEPNGTMRYQCEIPVWGVAVFDAQFRNESLVECTLDKQQYLLSLGQMKRGIHLNWSRQSVDGSFLTVLFYDCKRLTRSCDKCKSYAGYQPHYQCHWCGGACDSDRNTCTTANNVCPNPSITRFDDQRLTRSCDKCKSYAGYQPHYQCHWCGGACDGDRNTCTTANNVCPKPSITRVTPLSAAVNTTIIVTIGGSDLGSSFNETVNAVTITGLPCRSIERLYTTPSESIQCELAVGHEEMSGAVNVTLPRRETVRYADTFYIRVPELSRVFPEIGPQSGGTIVTISGRYLNTGNRKTVFIGNNTCESVKPGQAGSSVLECTTPKLANLPEKSLNITVKFDNSTEIVNENVNFTYVVDPEITSIWPRRSFMTGGRRLTVRGTNLHAIQRPLIFARYGNGQETNQVPCKSVPTDDSEMTIVCQSPCINGDPHDCPSDTSSQSKIRMRREIETAKSARIGFVMDGVMSVKWLPDSLGRMEYFQDPFIPQQAEVFMYQNILIIEGERLAEAASKEDVQVSIGMLPCNVTTLNNESIYCNPPPLSAFQTRQDAQILVSIGYILYHTGYMRISTEEATEDDSDNTIGIAAGVSVVVLLLILAAVLGFLLVRKTKAAKQQNTTLVYKLDKLEGAFRTQCREEFAALQTAVSDLTSDLEGGNVLFRDYPVYASKTLFPRSRHTHPIMSPPQSMTSGTTQAMDNFKALMRNTQFLRMFIRTLEKEKTFSIQDKSNMATILMALNHDNLEFITDILKTLLGDLVDKNVAANTPKLMLRRSESVSEKLLTHWLSICLYHYLKDCSSGSALFILYKAIKTQVEKGPMDYITCCGKYTLSEDKLFTSADTAVNAKTLVLQVSHFHHIDNEEKQISAPVLDCDTVTQAKAKMLEILYKNVPYTQRPSVHNTMLEIKEADGTARAVNDEDSTSLKEGLWKKINTLLHYKVQDGTSARLLHRTEAALNLAGLAEASPEAYIVGSYRKSRPVVRTISGSNYWHLMKQNLADDDLKISSDFFLPRLISTKGTLQTYIDDLFTAMLTAGQEPPIIIKYLFDFLDAAADRHGITDPDVIHTWKCNSVLLRFWVNILKNPEFVFDIHKPQIVDSCLSVVAQTLMDSCSTADLNLGPHSPSNKLLFAKDIPRYKTMVRKYFQDLKELPPISDQELNSYLTERVSQKFSGEFNSTSALLEMYKYAEQYKTELINEMDNLEAGSPGSFFQLSSKLEGVFACMDMQQKQD